LAVAFQLLRYIGSQHVVQCETRQQHLYVHYLIYLRVLFTHRSSNGLGLINNHQIRNLSNR